MTSVLVGFATAKGSTEGVAERIGERLRLRGHVVDVREMGAVSDIAGFDAFVLGSAIHSGSWLPEASRFIDRNVAGLANRPAWLFSVSSVGETSSFFPSFVARGIRKMRGETKEIGAFRHRLDVAGHRNFAGSIARGDWGRVGEIFLKLLGGRYGDRRDWADIDSWAEGIAGELGRRPT